MIEHGALKSTRWCYDGHLLLKKSRPKLKYQLQGGEGNTIFLNYTYLKICVEVDKVDNDADDDPDGEDESDGPLLGGVLSFFLIEVVIQGDSQLKVGPFLCKCKTRVS